MLGRASPLTPPTDLCRCLGVTVWISAVLGTASGRISATSPVAECFLMHKVSGRCHIKTSQTFDPPRHLALHAAVYLVIHQSSLMCTRDSAHFSVFTVRSKMYPLYLQILPTHQIRMQYLGQQQQDGLGAVAIICTPNHTSQGSRTGKNVCAGKLCPETQVPTMVYLPLLNVHSFQK